MRHGIAWHSFGRRYRRVGMARRDESRCGTAWSTPNIMFRIVELSHPGEHEDGRISIHLRPPSPPHLTMLRARQRFTLLFAQTCESLTILGPAKSVSESRVSFLLPARARKSLNPRCHPDSRCWSIASLKRRARADCRGERSAVGPRSTSRTQPLRLWRCRHGGGSRRVWGVSLQGCSHTRRVGHNLRGIASRASLSRSVRPGFGEQQ